MQKKILLSTIYVYIILILSKVLGLGREMLIGSTYGADWRVDVFVIVSTIPTVVLYLITNGVSSAFIPIYNKCISETNDENEAIKVTNNIVNIVFFTSIALMILGIFFSPILIKIIAPGFSEEQYLLAVKYLRIFFITIIFVGIEGVITGFLQCNNKFMYNPLSITIFNISSIILILVLSPKMGIYGLVVGTIISTILRVVIIIIGAFKSKYKYKLYINFNDKYLKILIKMIIPIILSTLVLEVNVIVDKSFASLATEGAISIINYSDKILSLIRSLFYYLLSFIIFPILSKMYYKNKKKYSRSSSVGMYVIMYFTVFIAIYLFISAEDIVKLIYFRGSFRLEAIYKTSIVFKIYSLSLIWFVLKDFIKNLSITTEKTKVILLATIVNMLTNVVLDIILFNKYGIYGLAIATTISVMMEFIIFFINYIINNKFLVIRYLVHFSGAIVFSILVIFIVQYFIINILNNSLLNDVILIRQLVLGIISLGLYILIIMIFNHNNIKYSKEILNGDQD